MNLDDLKPGALRECVQHYRLDKVNDGAGGHRREPTLRRELRVAWEESTPTNRITGEVVTQSSTATMGTRKRCDLRHEDLIVRDGEVYRVLGRRTNSNSRYQIIALERRDGREVPQ